MKRFIYSAIFLLLFILTLGKIKNVVASSKSPLAVFNQFYQGGGIRAVLLGFGPVISIVLLLFFGYTQAAGFITVLIPFFLILLAVTEPNPKP